MKSQIISQTLRTLTRCAAGLLLGLWGCGAGAATFVKADATALLGPAFFVDDTIAGGGDVIINQPATGGYVRTWGGVLSSNMGPVELRITGFGFATSANLTNNDASTLTLSFTYLGADGAAGGGDDVFIGAATAGYAYDANGEYACVFDTPLAASLDLTALRFQITIAPTNTAGDGSVRFKTGSVPLDGITGARFSVVGTVSGVPPAAARRVNLAKYQVTTASTTNGQYQAGFATDGVVGNGNSWRTLNVSTPHWAEVMFPVPVTIRSAHVYGGINDGSAPASFKVQYFSGGNWLDAPGSSRAGNTSTEVNVIFTSAVTSDRFRLHTDVDGNVRVKEFALFPPNPDALGVEQGFPIGTDVELNLAAQRPVVATAASGTNHAKLAVDGYVSGASKWQTSLAGSNSLEIDLRVATKIGSAHLYSGDGAVPPLTNFVLQYGDGVSWTNISGGSVSGNTDAARVVTFSPEPSTTRVRLVFTNTAVSAVRELCVFPANGGAGHPPGQDVLGAGPVTNRYEQFNNAYYSVQNRAADLPLGVSNAAPVLYSSTPASHSAQYQVLLNIGTDTYRLRNRATGRCLAGAGVSTNAGAPLMDEDYTAMPHQQWRLVGVDGTNFYLINRWSGLVADTQAGGEAAGTPLVQAALGGTTSQRWRFIQQAHFPKKGMAGFLARHEEIRGNWAYNWSRTNNAPDLPGDVVFNPMQWGDFNWDIGSTQGPIEQFISRWQREDRSHHLLGFNEPDGAEQSDLTVAEVLELWPRLERMNMPLVGPVTVSPENSWMTNFMALALARGHRMDAIAAHTYPGPNGGNSDALVSLMQNFRNDWNRPVWLTEFSTVNWSGTGTWTEEDNYNWLAEFLWRAESLPWLRHYSLFIFTAATNYPTPTNPWDPVGPRSNAYESNGVTPTAFGELYFAWDGDAAVRGDKAYFLHNKAERKRLRNAVGSGAPSHRWIRDGGDTVQWVLRPSGTAGQWHIVSLRDGRLLRFAGGVLDFAPPFTTGAGVRWNWTEDQHGWFFIENPAAPAANRRLRLSGTTFSMAANTTTSDNVKWRFVVPFAPLETAPPAAPPNLAAIAGDAEVALTWNAATNADFSFYSLHRSTTNGGPYSLVAVNLTATAFTNGFLSNGTRYHYVVTATDWTGLESAPSNPADATPVAALPPAALGLAPNGNGLAVSWPATHLGWMLQTQTNGLASNNWSTVTNSTGTNWMAWPMPPEAQSIFFRVIRP